MNNSMIKLNLSLKYKIKKRILKLGIDLDNLAKLAGINKIEVVRFLNLDFVPKDILYKITTILGLDFYGKEIKSVKQLKKDRAKFKAIRVVSMVQDTSSLEKQGLESMAIKRMIVRTEKEFLLGQYSSRLWK